MTRFTWLSAFTLLLCAGIGFPASAQEKSGESKAAETKAAESKSEPEHDPAAASKAAGATNSAEDDHPAAEGAKGEAHVDHAGHDENALEHGDASPALASPADLRFDLSIYTLIVFLILLAVLYKFAWAPISAGLEKREQTIAKQIADAEHASAMAAKQLQEYERKLAAATEEARAIVTQARQDAITAKDKIVAEAQSAASKERDRAVADIASAKNQALREIAQQSVSTAISLASNIIRREVKPEDHDKLIADSLSKFSNLN